MRISDKPGHESGHGAKFAARRRTLEESPPSGLTWNSYLEHFLNQTGGWTALANELIRRMAHAGELDLQSVEKGLRRLAGRGNRDGGRYGNWMLRHFGVPAQVEDWARWLAQYHSRFADLPTSLRLEQLRLWDRPPLSASKVSAWIHVGLASVLHRITDLDNSRRRLHLAEDAARHASAAVNIEIKLFKAYIATNEGRRGEAAQLFDEVDALLSADSLTRADALSYRARLAGQRAYHLTKPAPGENEDLQGALTLFRDIEQDLALPFVCFRRAAGLAYCTWKLGQPEEGARLARLAADFAGDGGFVRFRIMALNLLSRMVPQDEARDVNARALRLAKQLQDEDLVRRVVRLQLAGE